MSRFAWPQSLIAVASFCAVACSLVFDASDIDQGCPEGQKFCDGHCVNRGPAYGCGAACRPCAIPNAIPKCHAEDCAVEACVWGFMPAEDGNPPTDCSVNFLVDRARCGAPPDTKACTGDEICVDGECSAQADDSLQ